MERSDRNGLIAGGNFITDFVKIIDGWPPQDTLALISEESMSNGGGAYNVLKNLSSLDLDWPLEAVGRIGDDPNGRWILDDCRAAGIDIRQLVATRDAPTSYTDAMTVAASGRRTFFHQTGANALLSPEDFDFSTSRARIFFLGFLMLLERLDGIDSEGRTGASHVIEAASEAGLMTAADLVTASDPRLPEVAKSSIPYLDLLFVNELEAGLILKRTVEPHRLPMKRAAEDLLELGVRDSVVVHCAEGSVAVNRSGRQEALGRVNLPTERVAGSTGAGDAFAAGYLSGWHDAEDPAECLARAVSVAAASVTAATASDGVTTLAECLKLGADHGYLEF